jgi:hypothetical protein
MYRENLESFKKFFLTTCILEMYTTYGIYIRRCGVALGVLVAGRFEPDMAVISCLLRTVSIHRRCAT